MNLPSSRPCAITFALAFAAWAPLRLAPAQERSLPHKPASISKDGKHRLQLENIRQVKSPRDPGACEVQMQFRLGFSQDGIHFDTSAPSDVCIESVNPYVKAILPTGEDLDGRRHSGWADDSGPSLYLEVGPEQKKLSRLSLVMVLVRVTKWETLEFKGLTKSNNTLLHCGPFEISCSGGEKYVELGVSASSEFRDEHERYRKRVPLNFLTHAYAAKNLLMTDAQGRSQGMSAWTRTGGHSGGRLSIVEFPKDRAATNAMDALGTPVSVAYPISLKLKLPKKYSTERIYFEFSDLEAPSLE